MRWTMITKRLMMANMRLTIVKVLYHLGHQGVQLMIVMTRKSIAPRVCIKIRDLLDG